VTARDNWYMAAIHYGAAEWPYDDSGPQHLALHAKKRECYSSYARLADHRIEAVSIPFKGKSIPAWFHLSPGYSGGKLPVVIAIPGMDSFKEASVALANDRWMARGVAVLAIDGPGQYESRAAATLPSSSRPPRRDDVLAARASLSCPDSNA
jgi:hypothetical protein